jgi:hypothetical protein
MRDNPRQQRSIDSYLENIIKESLQGSIRKERLSEADETSDTKKLKSGEISFDDIIGKLNAIRSGRSFKDEDISNKLQSYINDMTKAEKTALFAFLKGVLQIVSGEFEAEKAVEPESAPANIEITKKGGKSKVTLKPIVIKKPEGSKEEKKKKPAEDTAGPVPITPKK